MTIGGAQQVIRQLVENMGESEILSEVVCIDNRLGELGEILQDQGIKIHLLSRQPGFDFSLVKQLHQLIKTEHYDIIHCHQYSPYVYGVLASLLTPSKVMFTEHGRFYPDYGSWKRKLINPFFALKTKKIIAISEATKKALIKYENIKSEKIEVIYNGVSDLSSMLIYESALKQKFGIPQQAFIFGTISRLQPIKNQILMINAFKKVHEQFNNAHLLVVGDGVMRDELEIQATNLGLDQSITFTGFQKEPHQFHKIIDVFLLTSFSEGTSMTLLEAMSFSTPCIVTRVGGNPEIVQHLKNGMLISSDNVTECIEGQVKLITNQELTSELGENARLHFLQHFTQDKMVNRYSAIYQEAAG
jgi:glycosyltransferase involved in cell wall biosynthesis